MSATTKQTPEPRALWDALGAEEQALLRRAAASAAAEGGDASLVGGPVRDLLRGDAQIHDIDIVTTVDARQVAERFAAQGQADVAKTTEFGTATVHVRGDERGVIGLDFATARTETYPRPGALPAVTYPVSISDDLHRRDVTINAMALPITADGFGDLIDPTGGLADLRGGVIRILHDASFRDDPTRLYRTVRYAARFGSVVEAHTAALLREAVAGGALTTVSRDRKRHELELGLLEPDAVTCFTAFDDFGLLLATSSALVWDDWVATRVRHYVGHTDASSLRASLGRAERFVPTLFPIWAFFVSRQDDATVDRLLTDVPVGAMEQPVRWLVRVWREREFIATSPRLSMLAPLLDRLHVPEVQSLLHGEPAAARATEFFERQRHIREQDIRWARSFGNLLRELGIPSGPVYKEILTALRNARLDGRVDSAEEAEEFIRIYRKEHDLTP